MAKEQECKDLLEGIAFSLQLIDEMFGEGTLPRGVIDGAFVTDGGLKGIIEKIYETTQIPPAELPPRS